MKKMLTTRFIPAIFVFIFMLPSLSPGVSKPKIIERDGNFLKFDSGVVYYRLLIWGDIMFIVHVFVHVKEDQIEAFRQATLENARNSIKESGIARFDVVQQQDDPTRFILVEVYRTPEDPAKHKETEHYKKWRDTVADMMAESRTSIKLINVFPDEKGWD
jgi:quinol monooxygenase YgiN